MDSKSRKRRHKSDRYLKQFHHYVGASPRSRRIANRTERRQVRQSLAVV